MKMRRLQQCGLGVIYALLVQISGRGGAVPIEKFERVMQSTPGISLPPGANVTNLVEDMERYHMVLVDGTTLRVVKPSVTARAVSSIST